MSRSLGSTFRMPRKASLSGSRFSQLRSPRAMASAAVLGRWLAQRQMSAVAVEWPGFAEFCRRTADNTEVILQLHSDYTTALNAVAGPAKGLLSRLNGDSVLFTWNGATQAYNHAALACSVFACVYACVRACAFSALAVS